MKPVRAAALLVLGAVVVVPACGKRGDPQPPFSRVPQPVTGLDVVQRGDVLEVRYEAPQATAGGLALEGLEIEVLRADRAGDFEDVALRERRRAEPGEEVVQSMPLPVVGTPLRLAARAHAGGRRSPLAGPVSLVVKDPPPAPTAVVATETPDAVVVRWTPPPGWTPPTPSPSPSPGASVAPSPTPTPEVRITPAPQPTGGRGERAGRRGGRGGRAGAAGAARAGRPTTRPNAPFNPGFNVYRRVGDGDWTKVTPTPLLFTEFRDPSAPAGTVCYSVRHASAAQLESVASAPTCVTRTTPAPPAPEESTP